MEMQGQGMQGNLEGCVKMCDVQECSWNQQQQCTAPSIEVGDEHPKCDTYTTSGASMGGQPMGGQSMGGQQMGGQQMGSQKPPVQKCMVDECTYNQTLQCHAPGIQVTHHSGHADCGTYQKR